MLSPSQHHDKLQPTSYEADTTAVRVEFFNQVPPMELKASATVADLRAAICKLLKANAHSRWDLARPGEFDICAGNTVLDESQCIVDTHVWPMPFNTKWRRDGMGRHAGDPYDVLALAREDIVSGDRGQVDTRLLIGGSPLERFNTGIKPLFTFEDPARDAPASPLKASRFDPPNASRFD